MLILIAPALLFHYLGPRLLTPLSVSFYIPLLPHEAEFMHIISLSHICILHRDSCARLALLSRVYLPAFVAQGLYLFASCLRTNAQATIGYL
jgi:hypothetical protein